MKAPKLRKLTDCIAFAAKAFNKLHLIQLSMFLFKCKDKIVLDYLYKHYNDFIENYTPQKILVKKRFEISPIWICWLQGEDKAPLLVQKCLASIRSHANGHPVVLISEKNIGDYVDIPDQILAGLDYGILSRTSFSDIIRSALLASYGGMWIDATFFITRDLPESYFKYSLFSAAKQPEPRKRRNVCISKSRWTTSFIGAKDAGHLLFCFVRDFFFEFMKIHTEFIDYLLFDYIIYLAYKHFPNVKNDIAAIPNNNIDFGWLFHAMNKPFALEKAKDMFHGSTFAYKLSWKKNWKKNLCGRKTFYGAFLDGDFDNVF